jgi:hypothetical protein
MDADEKEKSMTFTEKMQDIIDTGVAASRTLINRASEKAIELGALGVVRLEIVQLQSHAEKLIAKLGNEVYATLVDKDHSTVSRDTRGIRDILGEIAGLRARVELKEREYESIGGKDDKVLSTAHGA